MKKRLQQTISDILYIIAAGLIVGFAFYFFQNSNGFAPGGVGGLATMTYFLLNYKISWAILMILFNIPIFIVVSLFVNKKLGFYLILYLIVQALSTELFSFINLKPYSAINNAEDFEIIFACIATGVISGIGFSLMLRRFGASGGTYAISAIVKKIKPQANIAYIAFLLDSSVVVIAFFVYGMKVTPVIATLLNLFIANIIVDYVLTGIRNGYKFEIITDEPDKLSEELINELGRGVTNVHVQGMYSHTDKYMLICIISKKQIGKMMMIIKKHPGTFANFAKVNEVFGRFRKYKEVD